MRYGNEMRYQLTGAYKNVVNVTIDLSNLTHINL